MASRASPAPVEPATRSECVRIEPAGFAFGDVALADIGVHSGGGPLPPGALTPPPPLVQLQGRAFSRGEARGLSPKGLPPGPTPPQRPGRSGPPEPPPLPPPAR